MCGIAGILRIDSHVALELPIREMTRALAHRGPDAEGFYNKDCIALGHRRLSILDTSSASNQPFSDSSGRYQMVYNGEIYNFRQLSQKLAGFEFRTSGDTELLLQWFTRFGITGLNELAGMFAFAVWDEQERSLCLVRDRLGVKPLYYYQDEQHLIFASEIRSILASGLVKAEINPAALHDFFRYQSVSVPDTMIKGIRQLPPGMCLRYCNGQATLESYWDITETRNPLPTSDEFKVKRDIHDLMMQAVERRMVSDVPVGAFLSGGIDSTAVVGLMSRLSNRKVDTFTIAFSEKQFDESAFATLVARRFNTEHQNILIRPDDMLSSLGDALNAMDSPSGDGVNTYLVSKAVRSRGISVALTGAGGDELFAGYPFFQHYIRLRNNSLVWDNTGMMRRLLGKTLAFKSKYRDLMNTDSASIVDLYPVFRQVLPPSVITAIVDAPENDRIANQLEMKRREVEKFPLYSQVTIAELTGYTRNTLMLDLDQMSMAHALEVREPFFDHDLVQYVLQVPDALKTPAIPKKLLVESLGGLLPDEVVFRAKKGFLLPWKDWLKKELKSFCEMHLLSLSRRPFVDGENLGQLWEDFLHGNQQVRWTDVWLFVVLEHWLQKNGVQC